MGNTGKGDWKEEDFKFSCYRAGDAYIQVDVSRRQVDTGSREDIKT